jgi:hypothetical protein
MCEKTSGTYFINKERRIKMRKAVTLERIEKEIERLSPQEQLKLVERLAH